MTENSSPQEMTAQTQDAPETAGQMQDASETAAQIQDTPETAGQAQDTPEETGQMQGASEETGQAQDTFEVKKQQIGTLKKKLRHEDRRDISEMTEEEIQAPIREFKNKSLPTLVAVLGCIAAVAYLLWMFGVFGH